VIRRFNFTERQRIGRDDVRVTFLPSALRGRRPFEVRANLRAFGFPDVAVVRLEAWRSNAVERWNLGSVGEMSVVQRLSLAELPESAQFRLTVVAADGSGRLLGRTPPIRAQLQSRSLLPVRETDELRGELWRLDFGGDDDQPELLLNSRVRGISQVVRSDGYFRALVMPDVLRAIFTEILIVRRQDPADEEGPWRDWFRFAERIRPGHELPPPGEEGARRWINELVERFAEKSVKAVRSFNAARK